MSNANRVFVALDASDRAPIVLAAAERLSKLTGGMLVLFQRSEFHPISH